MDSTTMPVWTTSLLAALAAMEDTFQPAPTATTSAVWLNAHDERLVRRHLATSSASKALPVEDKLTSSWDLPESIKMASSSGSNAASIAPTASSAASIAPTASSASSDSTVDAVLGVDGFFVRAPAGRPGRRASQ
ncbi:hypothetical protein T484DRAFT_1921076 [Baffinella frigidus]|nr:hypothetical protein T484DRAFT_1921076 [Cryptophyta sp. CCMP2293]